MQTAYMTVCACMYVFMAIDVKIIVVHVHIHYVVYSEQKIRFLQCTVEVIKTCPNLRTE